MFSFSNSTYNTGCNEALSYFFWFEFCSAEFTAEEGRARQQTAGTIIRKMQREIWLCIGWHACIINIKLSLFGEHGDRKGMQERALLNNIHLSSAGRLALAARSRVAMPISRED